MDIRDAYACGVGAKAVLTNASSMQFHLGNENAGGNEVKDEAAVPEIEPENLAAPEHHSLAQIMGCHKSNIPTQEEFNSKSAACKQQATHMTKLLPSLLPCSPLALYGYSH